MSGSWVHAVAVDAAEAGAKNEGPPGREGGGRANASVRRSPYVSRRRSRRVIGSTLHVGRRAGNRRTDVHAVGGACRDGRAVSVPHPQTVSRRVGGQRPGGGRRSWRGHRCRRPAAAAVSSAGDGDAGRRQRPTTAAARRARRGAPAGRGAEPARVPSARSADPCRRAVIDGPSGRPEPAGVVGRPARRVRRVAGRRRTPSRRHRGRRRCCRRP